MGIAKRITPRVHSNFRQPYFRPGSSTEEVLRLHDAGVGPRRIAEQTGLMPHNVRGLIALHRPPSAASPETLVALTAAERLRHEVFAESDAIAARRAAAVSQSTTAFVPIEHGAILSAPSQAIDHRPAALDRDPCKRCGTRGDLGCAHRRPYEQEA
jgi:hypothetical protein